VPEYKEETLLPALSIVMPGKCELPKRLMPNSCGPNGCAVLAKAFSRTYPILCSQTMLGEMLILLSIETV